MSSILQLIVCFSVNCDFEMDLRFQGKKTIIQFEIFFITLIWQY